MATLATGLRTAALRSLRPRAGPRAALSTSSIDARAATTSAEIPTLPMMPVLGTIPWAKSLVSRADGTPLDILKDDYETWPLLSQKYGPLYRLGLFGIGRGLYGEVFVNTCPREHLKVVRAEGRFPFGGVQMLWPAKAHFKDRGMRGGEQLFHQGEDWRRLRLAMQRDLLPPDVALGYLPGIAEAARHASAGAARHADRLAEFTARASFDMFSTINLGRLTRTADPDPASSDPADLAFCHEAMRGLAGLNDLLLQPHHRLLFALFGVKTALLRAFYEASDAAYARARALTDELLARADAGEAVTPLEANCYVVRAVRRLREQAEPGEAAVAEGELKDLVNVTLLASVDTTSSLMNWALVHLARNPGAQEQLHAEVAGALGGGPLTAETVTAGRHEWLPYLNGCLRESHRLTPSIPITTTKVLDAPTELHGRTLPPGSVVGLDMMSAQMDPAVVEAPLEFRPERWLPEAVAARAGTPAEVIDHRLLAGPFSAGQRMCPGSRVARLEVRAFLAQFVQDWRFRLAEGTPERIAYKAGTTIMPDPMPKFVLEARR